MAIERKVLVVQFTHPGAEHTISLQEKKTGVKQWNYSSHRRKFLRTDGQYILEEGTLSAKQTLLFWGEWEPASKFKKIDDVIGQGIVPVYVHEPFVERDNDGLVLPPLSIKIHNKDKKRQNTDPFVFGECFLYSCCKQRRKNMVDITQIGMLEKGSIILFGSTISSKWGSPYFVLDTVFVVGDYMAYYDNKARSGLCGYVPQYYCDIMGYEDNANNDGRLFMCYKGATASNPVDSMFSFVPCRPCSGKVLGFPRVKLTQDDLWFISNNLNAAPKYTHTDNPKQIWDNLCEIVKSQGFELGVNFEYTVL